MRTLIAIAALVASVTAIAGELDGKYLICEPRKFRHINIGASFHDGFVEMHGLRDDGLNFTVDRLLLGGEYTVTRTHVEWRSHRLDRKTLKLTLFAINTAEPIYEQQCEVVLTRSEFRERLEKYQVEYQKKAEAEMKDNKI